MIEKKSAGAIIFNDILNEKHYLLLLYGAGHWDFPKGGIESGESELDTVKREVWEETGIKDLEFIDGFRKIIQYYYKSYEKLVKKTVVFYLARSHTLEVRLSYEHKAFAWLRLHDALQQLTFKTAKKVLEEADSYLNRREKQASLKTLQ